MAVGTTSTNVVSTSARGGAAAPAATRGICAVDSDAVPDGVSGMIQCVHGNPPCWITGGESPRMLSLCGAAMRNAEHSFGFNLEGLPVEDAACAHAHLGSKCEMDYQSVQVIPSSTVARQCVVSWWRASILCLYLLDYVLCICVESCLMTDVCGSCQRRCQGDWFVHGCQTARCYWAC